MRDVLVSTCCTIGSKGRMSYYNILATIDQHKPVRLTARVQPGLTDVHCTLSHTHYNCDNQVYNVLVYVWVRNSKALCALGYGNSMNICNTPT